MSRVSTTKPYRKKWECAGDCDLSFSNLGLQLNWKIGKSEAVVRLTGRHCCRGLETLRQPDENLAFTLPERCGGKVLHIVACYKHQGTFVRRGCHAKDARTTSMSAYVKLIPSALSFPCYTVAMKLHCVRLFVMSRALFNAHLWVVDSRVYTTERFVVSLVSPGRWGSRRRSLQPRFAKQSASSGLTASCSKKRLEYLARLASCDTRCFGSCYSWCSPSPDSMHPSVPRRHGHSCVSVSHAGCRVEVTQQRAFERPRNLGQRDT